MRNALLVIPIFLLACAAYAQTPNCAQTLRLANSTYEQGRLHEVEALLTNCINNGFNDDQKVAAYKILCLTYLYLEEPEKADQAMLSLLRTNPYFIVNKDADPAEFVALYRTFRTYPIYRIGANVGVNATQPNVVSTLSTVIGAQSEYKYKIGFQFAITADVPLSQKITLNTGVGLHQKAFELTSANDQGDGDINELVATEKLSWLSLPVMAQYKLSESKYNPYVAIGASADMLMSASISALRTRQNETAIEAKSFEIKPHRNSLNISAILAAGSKIRVGGGYLVTELRYIYGFNEVSDESSAYQDQDLYMSYGMPTTVFKLTSLSFTAGYVQNIFNPKKLKRK